YGFAVIDPPATFFRLLGELGQGFAVRGIDFVELEHQLEVWKGNVALRVIDFADGGRRGADPRSDFYLGLTGSLAQPLEFPAESPGRHRGLPSTIVPSSLSTRRTTLSVLGPCRTGAPFLTLVL